MGNKLFEIKFASKPEYESSSRIKFNRDYLISQRVAEELNTYASFTPFSTFNDAFSAKYGNDGKEVYEYKDENGKTQSVTLGAPGVRSIFNKMGAVMIGGTSGEVAQLEPGQCVTKQASQWRLSNNVPLMDNRTNRTIMKKSSGCSVKELVEASAAGELGRATYDYSDFMYCKYLGKISNNYLITLRRFPLPVDDYIATQGLGETRRNKNIASKNAQCIGCMVTWMGTPGNDMSNILKYGLEMPYKFQKSQMHQSNMDADSQKGVANGIAAMFDPTYRQQYNMGMAGGAVNDYMGKFFGAGPNPYSASSFSGFQDQNKAYGPVDAIKGTYMRSEDGIDFKQTITLNFDYELRAYNGINSRQAMLDLLSNILAVTYTTGTFWGGGYRGGGAHQNNIFANLEIFKCKGGFTDFMDAFANDITTVTESFRTHMEKEHGGSWLNMLKSAINQLGGMIMGGMLNKLGRPARATANSLLSPAPIGFWHLTVGNPHHPIMSVGNLVLKGVVVEHYGPLGIDDFPTGLKVTVNLERGKPRDIRDIEKIYMHGNDRIYTSMGPKVFDMYKKSKEYRSLSSGDSSSYISPEVRDVVNSMKEEDLKSAVMKTQEIPSSGVTIEAGDIKNMSYIMQKYFGHVDTYSIYVSACEQEYGAHKKKKTAAAEGDSSKK